MKTFAESITVSIAIYTVLLVLVASIAYGSELNFNLSAKSELNPEEIVFQEEEYIEDIPFDTKAIAENYLLEESMNSGFYFGDETYVDDIPFNTEKVARENMDQYVSVK